MNRNLILLIIAIVCFLIALILATSLFGISGGNEPAWIAGGLLAFACAHLP